MGGAGPVVFHADADAFFVACHQAEDASLRGRSMVVAGDPKSRHGVVLSASYEARRRGVRNAMPLARARALDPKVLVIAPDRSLYSTYGRRLAEVFADFSPRVERLSIDEAWIDMQGGLGPWRGDAAASARALKIRVRDEVRVTVSVGVAPNKYLAKQASDLDKPDGLCLLLDAADVERRLWPLRVGELYGCGAQTARRLEGLGIVTIGDLAHASPSFVAGVLGSHARRLVARARGEDDVAVAAEPEEARSVGAERTLAEDLWRDEAAQTILLSLAEEVAARLRAMDRDARRVVLKYKTARFRTHTHQRTLSRPTAHAADLYAVACDLWRERALDEPVRLLGVQAGDLAPRVRQAVLGEVRRRDHLDAAVDAIRQRFGQAAIRPARLLDTTRRPRGGKGGERT